MSQKDTAMTNEIRDNAAWLFDRDVAETPNFECAVERFLESLDYAERRSPGIVQAGKELLRTYARATSDPGERLTLIQLGLA